MKSALKFASIVSLIAAVSAWTFAPTPAHAQTKPRNAAAARPAAPKKAPAAVEAAVVAYVGAKVYTGSSLLEDAVVVVSGDKIQSVGKGITPPAGAKIIKGDGWVITPGLVDAFTQVGLTEVDLEKSANDAEDSGTSDRIRAGYRAAEAYNPASAVIGVVRAGGLTSVGVVPGGGLIAGQSAWVDLVGSSESDPIVKAPLALHVFLGAGSDPGGGSRATSILRVREAFDDARTFAKNKAAWEKNQSRPFAPSRLDLEAMVPTLGGGKQAPSLRVVFHVDRAPEILAAMKLAKEFGLKAVIVGGAEAWKVRRTLAKESVPVFINPFVEGPQSFDALGARSDNAALLHAAGVSVGLTTNETHNARKLRQGAGNAVRAGMPHTAAIESITRVPAQALGMDADYGTLDVGKKASFVVWSGDPLEIQTRVLRVVIRGRETSTANRQTELLRKYRQVVR